MTSSIPSEPFKATRIDMDSSGVTVWAFEDCATVARDAFPGVHHFIDELRAMDDGRLVGVQFWGPPPARAAEPGEAVTMEGSRGMTDEQIIEGMLIAANDACDDDDEDHAGAMAAAFTAAKPLIREQALREAAEPEGMSSQRIVDAWRANFGDEHPTDVLHDLSEAKTDLEAARADLARMKSALEKAEAMLEPFRLPFGYSEGAQQDVRLVMKAKRVKALRETLTAIAAALRPAPIHADPPTRTGKEEAKP